MLISVSNTEYWGTILLEIGVHVSQHWELRNDWWTNNWQCRWICHAHRVFSQCVKSDYWYPQEILPLCSCSSLDKLGLINSQLYVFTLLFIGFLVALLLIINRDVISIEFYPFRFKIYSAGTPSMQANSHAKMGRLYSIESDASLVRLSIYLLKFKLNSGFIFLRVYTLVLVGDLSIHACCNCLHSHRSCYPICFPRCMVEWNPIQCIIVYSFLVLHLVDQEHLFIRLLKLLIGMKLRAYQSPLKVIRSSTYKAQEIKHATELWR